MEFLDSLGHTSGIRKKSRRVRSWYLYEQYKSLELNQSSAAEKLKQKYCEDSLLRQELWEWRKRRSVVIPPAAVTTVSRTRKTVISEMSDRSSTDYYDTADYTKHKIFPIYCKNNTSISSLAPTEVFTPFEPCTESNNVFGDQLQINKKLKTIGKMKDVAHSRQKSDTTTSLLYSDFEDSFNPDAPKESQNYQCYTVETMNPAKTCGATKDCSCPKYQRLKAENYQKKQSSQDLYPEIITPNVEQIDSEDLSSHESNKEFGDQLGINKKSKTIGKMKHVAHSRQKSEQKCLQYSDFEDHSNPDAPKESQNYQFCTLETMTPAKTCGASKDCSCPKYQRLKAENYQKNQSLQDLNPEIITPNVEQIYSEDLSVHEPNKEFGDQLEINKKSKTIGKMKHVAHSPQKSDTTTSLQYSDFEDNFNPDAPKESQNYQFCTLETMTPAKTCGASKDCSCPKYQRLKAENYQKKQSLQDLNPEIITPNVDQIDSEDLSVHESNKEFGDQLEINKKSETIEKMKIAAHSRQRSDTSNSLQNSDFEDHFSPDAPEENQNYPCYTSEAMTPAKTCGASKDCACPKYQRLKSGNCQKNQTFQDFHPEIITPNVDQIDSEGFSDSENIIACQKDKQSYESDICTTKKEVCFIRCNNSNCPKYTPNSYRNCQFRQCFKTKFMPYEETNHKCCKRQMHTCAHGHRSLHSNDGLEDNTFNTGQNQWPHEQCHRKCFIEQRPPHVQERGFSEKEFKLNTFNDSRHEQWPSLESNNKCFKEQSQPCYKEDLQSEDGCKENTCAIRQKQNQELPNEECNKKHSVTEQRPPYVQEGICSEEGCKVNIFNDSRNQQWSHEESDSKCLKGQSQPCYKENLQSKDGCKDNSFNICQNQQWLNEENKCKSFKEQIPLCFQEDEYDESTFNTILDKKPKETLLHSAKASTNTEPFKIDDLKEELESVKRDIMKNLNMQVYTEKEKRQFLEQYSELCSVDNRRSLAQSSCNNNSDTESVRSERESMISVRPVKKAQPEEATIFGLWEKVVNFAYQLTQLSHGNCYYDYSYQFMTAILACDMICRGVNKTCRCLQRYVLPIEFNDLETPKASYTDQTKRCNKKKMKKKHDSPYRRQDSPKVQSKSIAANLPCTCSPQHRNSSSEPNRRKPWCDNKYHANQIIMQTKFASSHAYSNNKSLDSFLMEDFVSKESSDFHTSYASHHTVNPMLKISEFFDNLTADKT